jgi:RNA 2',3'-cyclic 3'-phosphodiesterase
MRLFVAIDLDEGARAAIATEQRRVAGAIGDADRSALKWVTTDKMHLTLVFLGEILETGVERLVGTLSSDFDRESFVVVFAGLGVFPSTGPPRVLWLGVREGASAVADVYVQVASRIEGVGIDVEKRAFHPHLTLGRWRSSRPLDARRALASDSGEEVARVRVDSVALYQSRLSPKGPDYTPLARAKLT